MSLKKINKLHKSGKAKAKDSWEPKVKEAMENI